MTLRKAGYIFLYLGLPLFLFLSIGNGRWVVRDQAVTVARYLYQVREILEDNSSGKIVSGISSSKSLSQIATELGAAPYPEDKLEIFPPLKYMMGGVITMKRAPIYTVIDGKRSAQYRSWASTVGEFFDENKIEIGDDDKVSLPLESKTELGMKVTIIRVALTTVHINEAVAYGTVRKDDKTLDEGKTRIERKGTKGTKVYSYLVRREDGIEVSRKLTKTEITVQPIDEILIIGTKPVITVACGKRADIKGWIIEAATQTGISANTLCCLMVKESNGNYDSVAGGGYKGLFQYNDSYWATASARSGFAGSSIFDPRAQVFTTAKEIARGQGGRWPPLASCR